MNLFHEKIFLKWILIGQQIQSVKVSLEELPKHGSLCYTTKSYQSLEKRHHLNSKRAIS